jgi:hypothetical protein
MSFKDNPKFAELQIEVERDITPGLPAVQRAIEFVRTRGRATSTEVHIVLGLDPDELASVHLADELERGVLVKQGNEWTLGAAALSSVGLIDVVEREAA